MGVPCEHPPDRPWRGRGHRGAGYAARGDHRTRRSARPRTWILNSPGWSRRRGDQGRTPHRAGTGRGSSRPRAASLRREGAPPVGPPESDQTPRGLPEPGVLPAAEGSPVDGAHPARDRLRHDPHLALPRGCGEDLAELLESHGAALAWTTGGWRVRHRSQLHGELTPIQQDAVKQLLTHDTGVLVAPPGTARRSGVLPHSPGAARWCWSTASHCSISGGRSSRCSSAWTRRRSAEAP